MEPIRPRLLFATSPIVRHLLTSETPGGNLVGYYLTVRQPERLVSEFLNVNVNAENTLVQERIGLGYELLLFVRAAFIYSSFFDHNSVTRFADNHRLNRAQVLTLRDEVVRLASKHSNALSFDDLDAAPRGIVTALLQDFMPVELHQPRDDATTAPPRVEPTTRSRGRITSKASTSSQRSVLVGRNRMQYAMQVTAKVAQSPVPWEPTCADDAGDGYEALIELAFGEDRDLVDASDLTEPEQWPDIFGDAWRSVRTLAPWKIDAFPGAPNIIGRSTTIEELVNLLPPFDEPVTLAVSQFEHRPIGRTAIDDRALVYSLDAPHNAMTIDAGIIVQSALELSAPSRYWAGFVLKQMEYRSASFGGFTELVCYQWRQLIEEALT